MREWQESPASALNSWVHTQQNWVECVVSALKFLSGDVLGQSFALCGVFCVLFYHVCVLFVFYCTAPVSPELKEMLLKGGRGISDVSPRSGISGLPV